MNDEEHIKLASVLNSVIGKIAISDYECELMDKLYSSPKWKKHLGPEKTNPIL